MKWATEAVDACMLSAYHRSGDYLRMKFEKARWHYYGRNDLVVGYTYTSCWIDAILLPLLVYSIQEHELKQDWNKVMIEKGCYYLTSIDQFLRQIWLVIILEEKWSMRQRDCFAENLVRVRV